MLGFLPFVSIMCYSMLSPMIDTIMRHMHIPMAILSPCGACLCPPNIITAHRTCPVRIASHKIVSIVIVGEIIKHVFLCRSASLTLSFIGLSHRTHVSFRGILA